MNEFGQQSISKWFESQGLIESKDRFETALAEIEKVRQQADLPSVDVFLSGDRWQEWVAVGMAGLVANARVWFIPFHWKRREIEQILQFRRPQLVYGPISFDTLRTDSFCDPIDSTGIMIPTGGSSGRVKFAHHNAATFTSAVMGMGQFFLGRTIQRGDFEYHSNLPLYHVSGWMQLVRAYLSDSLWTIGQRGGFEKGNGKRWLSVVPTQLSRIVREKRWEFLRDFDFILVGGGRCNAEIIKQLIDRSIHPWVSYGLTETAGVAAARLMRSEDDIGKSAVALPHVRIETRKQKGLLEIGIRSSSLCLGMVGQDGYNGINEGIYWTRDFGMNSEEGLLIEGRLDGLINSGGEKVNPNEVQSMVSDLPGILECMIVGASDAEWGNIVVCIYTGTVESENEWKALLKKKIAAYKIPKRWVRVERLPLDQRGKIDSNSLNRILG
jgi:O-succinylbenzoic acid--CoA ligase